MIPEREREALMRLTMCAREECDMCKYKDTCNFDFQYETATRCMNILADALDADSKTENCSEIPNNCEKTDCDTCRYAGECDWEPWQECPYEPKDEPTISKMEQVDKDINVRSKDERQTDTEIAKAIVHKMIDDAVIAEDAYPDLRQKMHDAVDEYEPQTEDEILREQCRAFMGIVEQTGRSE